jgi:son of sevenless-like protein
LPKIVERVTHHLSPDTSFTIPFLVTYRTVATSDELLTLLLARMDLPEPQNKEPAEMARWAAQFRDPITARACNMLKHWVRYFHCAKFSFFDAHSVPKVTYHWTDFAEDDVLKQMMEDFFEVPIPSMKLCFALLTRRQEPIYQEYPSKLD